MNSFWPVWPSLPLKRVNEWAKLILDALNRFLDHENIGVGSKIIPIGVEITVLWVIYALQAMAAREWPKWRHIRVIRGQIYFKVIFIDNLEGSLMITDHLISLYKTHGPWKHRIEPFTSSQIGFVTISKEQLMACLTFSTPLEGEWVGKNHFRCFN